MSSTAGNVKLKAFRAAFVETIPIMTGFAFLGLTYGVYMTASGFPWYYSTITAAVVFGGSLEFLIVGMLCSAYNPLSCFLVAFAVQARHLFYGISMLDIYKDTGWKKPFLIFGMCDESFAINYRANVPEGVDKGWFMLFVTWLNQLYWVGGSTLGGLAGMAIPFPTEGLSFVMTALFTVIFLDEWLKQGYKRPAYVGFGCAIICLLAFGPDNFMIPAMVAMSALLLWMRPKTPDRSVETRGENAS